MTGLVAPGATTGTLQDAYDRCEAITRTEARNFYYGIRLLQPERRRALYAVYALARRVDDVADSDAPVAERLAGLATLRSQVATLGADDADPVLLAVGDAARRYPLPLPAFDELLDGVEMDLTGVTYDTFDDLVVYCRRVAGTIGRLCLGIYGADDLATASALADDLGVALQQTNILRDIREDLRTGRVYLPAQDLRRYRVTLRLDPDGRLGGPEPELVALVRAGTQRAEAWYARGLRLLDHLDHRSAACTAAMAGIYVRLNRRIGADPELVLTQRTALPGREKALVAGRALLGLRP